MLVQYIVFQKHFRLEITRRLNKGNNKINELRAVL
jgi:hypothetical protein